MLPHLWSSILISELVATGEAQIKTGPFGTQLKASEYVDTGTPVINVRNIGFGAIRIEKLEFISKTTVERLATHLLRKGDIVFGRKGSVERHVLIREAQNGWFQGSDCLRLRLHGQRVLPQFVSYCLLTEQHQRWMMNQCSHGATMASLNQDIISRISLPLPPLPIQRRIAFILSAYDDLIENNTRRIAILEEMARRIYEEWFVKFKFPGHEKVKMVDSELGKIPEGWKVIHLSNIVDTQYGYTESTQEKPIGPKFLRGMDINKQSYIDWSQVPYCPIPDFEFKKYQLKIGDIIVIRMADPGKIGIVEKSIDAVFASYLVRLKIKDTKITPYFLFYFLTSEYYQSYISGASTGTTRKSASAPVITGINLLLPTDNLIVLFERYVLPLRKLLNVLVDKNANLRTTRDFLLPKLISGEIDVSKLPKPEEAAA